MNKTSVKLIVISFICLISKAAFSAELIERNPFASALPGKKEVPIIEEKPKRVVAQPSLSIQGLVWQTPMPQAIINNKVVKVGEYLQDMQILDISKEGLVIEYQGERFFYSR